MSVGVQEERIWWHTVLQVIAATAICVPAVYAVGFVMVVLSFIQGEGIGIFLRAAQYGFAAYLSLYLPSLVLRRSHAAIAAAIWCTAVTTVFVVMLTIGASIGVSRDTGFWEWLEIAASVVGFVGGAIAYAYSDNT